MYDEPNYAHPHTYSRQSGSRDARSCLLAQAASTSAEVVFVCEHGAAKSVIAAAHFNHSLGNGALTFEPSLVARILIRK